MAFTSIDSNTIKVGDPITHDTAVIIKDDLDYLYTAFNSLSTTATTVFVLNGDMDFTGFTLSNPNIWHYKAKQDFNVNDFRAQLFTRQGVTSGNLVIDLQASTNTNNANFATILTTTISFNFATDADYAEKTATINTSLNTIPTGSVLRIKVTNIPTGYYGQILISIGAQ